MKRYYYKLYGLIIESEIEIPEVSQCLESKPDATIEIGNVPDKINNVIGKGILYEIAKGDFLFKLENVARYRVQDGKKITIQPKLAANSHEIILFLMGSVIGALLHQKRILALHGSAVTNKEKAVIFIGPSSSGKSSLAYGMYKRGYSFLSDDISVLTTLENLTYSVQPGIPQFKLWKDILNHVKHVEVLNKVRPTIEKYTLPISRSIADSAVPISCIISLKPKNSPGFLVDELIGVRKFNTLRDNTYRLQYLTKMQSSLLHFNQLSLLSKSVKVFELGRPTLPIDIATITEFIENDILFNRCSWG